MPQLPRPTPRTVRRLALASLVANVVIVLTGGAVRLTQSGLGCPTFPRCTDASYVTTPEMGIHGVIEFGNRLLTFVLAAIAVALLVAVWRQTPRPGMRRLALLGFLGIPAQAGLGGVTVLTGLNPWYVMAHFLLSMVLIGLAVVLHQRAREGDAAPRALVVLPLRRLAQAQLGLVAVVLAVGTLVTGSGPHSGDADTGRTGLDLEVVTQAHADLVFLLLGVTAASLVAFRVAGASLAARATAVLLGVELSQGLIGFAQYWTDLPELLVGLHLLGACLTLIAAVRVVLATRERGELSAERPAPPTRTAATPAPLAGTATAR